MGEWGAQIPGGTTLEGNLEPQGSKFYWTVLISKENRNRTI